MNIQRENLADQTVILKVTVEEVDYNEQVEKALKAHRRKATVPGFRPGMVPMGIINKMYRKSAIADQTYHAATDAAFEYIKEQKLDLMGDLMPAEEQGELNFDTDKSFEFSFQIGIAPEVNLDLTKNDTIEKFTIVPSEDMISGYRENFMKRYGKLVDVDKVESEEAISVTLSNDEMTIEDAYVGLISMDEEQRKPFIGKVVGDTMEVNVNEIYKDPKQRAALLSVDEKELDTLNPNFKLEVLKIRAFRNPELNEKFFTMAYPDGSIKDEEAFAADVLQKVNDELASQTDFKVVEQVRTYLLAKTNLSLPEAFLKNWLFQINEGKFTMEDIDKEFPAFLDMMRWDLIKRAVALGDKLEVTEDDAINEAKAMAMMQFRYYGMNQVADDMLENYSKQILSNKEEAKKIYEKVGERKVVDAITQKVTMAEKRVTIEEFSAMMQHA